jgi:hypothetical protein
MFVQNVLFYHKTTNNYFLTARFAQDAKVNERKHKNESIAFFVSFVPFVVQLLPYFLNEYSPIKPWGRKSMNITKRPP